MANRHKQRQKEKEKQLKEQMKKEGKETNDDVLDVEHQASLRRGKCMQQGLTHRDQLSILAAVQVECSFV